MVTMLEQRCNCWNNVPAMYAFNPQNLSNDAIVQQNRSDSHDYMEEIKLESRALMNFCCMFAYLS